MLLLVEGQRAIFGQKLRFHEVAAFKIAAQASAANQPAVPEADFITLLRVPAVADEYGGVSTPAGPNEGLAANEATGGEMPTLVAKALQLTPITKGGDNLNFEFSEGPDETSHKETVEIEARLKPTAERLRAKIDTKLAQAEGVSSRTRKSIAEILKQTVPDPAEVGLI